MGAGVFTVLGNALGFKRNRGGAHLFKGSRDDGAPTLLMRPRPGGPPLYEKDIEVHISASKEFGLAVTVARADAGSDAMLGDVLNEACENVDLARDKKWSWWDGAAVAPVSTLERPADAQVSPEETKAPVPAAAEPVVPSQADEAKLAGVIVRRLAPWFAVGLAVFLAAVWVFLHYQHAALLALIPRQPVPEGTTGLPNPRTQAGVELGERRLPLIDWQLRPPCEGASQEVDDGCWVELAAKPPCPKGAFERLGKCWMPMRAADKTREPRSGEAH